MKGFVHSIESFSALDGPGIRSVIFLQGCPMRCQYCHNPDSWINDAGELTDSSEVIRRIARNMNYISNKGGVTVSGGEPTMQVDFLQEILAGLKALELHTAVDTSGYVEIEAIAKIIDYTDLFIVDIKHMDGGKCKELTGKSNQKVFQLLEYLEKQEKEVWIRNVLYQGFTDDEEHIASLSRYVKKLNNVTRLEILPYHDMAKEKYNKINMDYRVKKANSLTSKGIQEYRAKYEKYYEEKIVI